MTEKKKANDYLVQYREVLKKSTGIAQNNEQQLQTRSNSVRKVEFTRSIMPGRSKDDGNSNGVSGES